jgi:Flp pilus assembly protein TadG
MIKRLSAKNQSGQAMVEFAVIVPIVLLILFAIIQFGILFRNYVTLTDAVRAGARQGAVSRHLPSGQEAAVEDRVRDSAVNLNQAKLDVATSVSPGWDQGADVTVTATYDYDINVLGFVVASGDLESTATERVE